MGMSACQGSYEQVYKICVNIIIHEEFNDVLTYMSEFLNSGLLGNVLFCFLIKNSA